MSNTPVYKETFKIRSSEVTPEGEARLSSICDLLQETAGNHALQLDFDISQLNEKKLTWVLHRLHVQMDQYPKWRDEVIIKTWPSSGDTLRAYRDFSICNSDGNQIGRSLSYWLMLNMENRRPVRMPEEVLAMAPADTEHVLDIKKDRITFGSTVVNSKKFTVRRNDLDINRHANNVKYIEWALETLPQERNVTEIDIEFRTECRLGEMLTSEVTHAQSEQITRHRIVKNSGGKIAAVATTR